MLDDWVKKCKEVWHTNNGSLPADHGGKIKQNGYWLFAYELQGTAAIKDKAALRKVLQNVPPCEAGWPMWRITSKKTIKDLDDAIECLYYENTNEPGVSEYWRVSLDGKALIIRGYSSTKDDQLFVEEPVLKLGECLMHAQKMATLFGAPDASMKIKAEFNGLKSRELISQHLTPISPGKYRCNQVDFCKNFIISKASDIPSSLSKIVCEELSTLYQRFLCFPYKDEGDGFNLGTESVAKILRNNIGFIH